MVALGTQIQVPGSKVTIKVGSGSAFEKPRQYGRWHYICAFNGDQLVAVSPRFDGKSLFGLPLTAFSAPMKRYVETKEPFPLLLLKIGSTNLCNLTCLDCYSGNLSANGTPINLQDLEKVIHDFPSLVERQSPDSAVISWFGAGEPLVNSRTRAAILDTVKKLAPYGIVTRIITNGTACDEDFLTEIMRSGNLRHLWVSMKTGSREAYKQHTGRDLFNRVIRMMEMAARTREMLGLHDHVELIASSEISAVDPFGFVAAARIAKELGFDVYEPKLHQPTHRQVYSESFEKVLKGRHELENLLDDHFLPFYWGIPLEGGFQPIPRVPYFCFQSQISTLLTASGDIWPCFRGAENAHLGQRLGNVRQESFREIFLRAATTAPKGDSEECRSCSLGLNRFNGFMQWMKDTITANHGISLSFMRGYDIATTQLD